MNAFIKKNEKLLKFYHVALRLSGLLLLTLGLCSYGIVIIMTRTLGAEAIGVATINLPLRSLHLILFGLLGIGIAQLIHYLYDHNYKPGFILRHGDKFLYTYIILAFTAQVIRHVFAAKFLADSDIENSYILYFSTLLISVALFAAEILILIGLAQFSKRIMPIIEEHKSLV